MFVGAWYMVRGFCIGQTQSNVLVVLETVDSCSNRTPGLFPISGPVLLLISSSDYTFLVFCRVKDCFRRLRYSCRLAWFNVGNGLMVGLIRDWLIIEVWLIIDGRNGSNVGEWMLRYVCIK